MPTGPVVRWLAHTLQDDGTFKDNIIATIDLSSSTMEIGVMGGS